MRVFLIFALEPRFSPQETVLIVQSPNDALHSSHVSFTHRILALKIRRVSNDVARWIITRSIQSHALEVI